jgi:hypothetical protein
MPMNNRLKMYGVVLGVLCCGQQMQGMEHAYGQVDKGLGHGKAFAKALPGIGIAGTVAVTYGPVVLSKLSSVASGDYAFLAPCVAYCVVRVLEDMPHDPIIVLHVHSAMIKMPLLNHLVRKIINKKGEWNSCESNLVGKDSKDIFSPASVAALWSWFKIISFVGFNGFALYNKYQNGIFKNWSMLKALQVCGNVGVAYSMYANYHDKNAITL